ncbi:MAG: nuclease, partial [Shimia sp.]
LALIRSPDSAADAYTAMVEENEVRVGLSYFERANIVARAVEAGVFRSESEALADLFASASRAKRSKIKSFLPVVEQIGRHLHYPAALTERLGLALAARLDDGAWVTRLRDRLRKAAVTGPEEEQALLQKALGEGTAPVAKPKPAQAVRKGAAVLTVTRSKGGLKITGPVDDALAAEIEALVARWR